MAPSIIALVRRVLGEGPATRKSTDFWNWKHHENPFGASYGLYAWDDEKKVIAGLRMLMRWGFKSPYGDTIQAMRAVDTATHPEYQRRGIFSTLTQTAIQDLTKEGGHFIFNTPNTHTSLPGYLKLGWSIVARWPLYIKIVKPVRLLLSAVQYRLGSQSHEEPEHYFDKNVVLWDVFVNKYQEQIPALLARWEMKRRHMGFRTVRDFPYLQWRYGKQPNIKYWVYAIEKKTELDGFIIVRPYVRCGLKGAFLDEIFLKEPSIEIGVHIIRSFFANFKGIYVISHFSDGTIERDILRCEKFFRMPLAGIVFTVKSLKDNDLEPGSAKNWDITLGDLEIF
jgi:hypothetical protein